MMKECFRIFRPEDNREKKRYGKQHNVVVLWFWLQKIKSLTLFNLGSELTDFTVFVLH